LLAHLRNALLGPSSSLSRRRLSTSLSCGSHVVAPQTALSLPALGHWRMGPPGGSSSSRRPARNEFRSWRWAGRKRLHWLSMICADQSGQARPLLGYKRKIRHRPPLSSHLLRHRRTYREREGEVCRFCHRRRVCGGGREKSWAPGSSALGELGEDRGVLVIASVASALGVIPPALAEYLTGIYIPR
jgi:hypothetical protein